MTSTITAVQSKGIYHGMPVYPDSIQGLSALVVGANGISGQYLMSALTENPERWSTVYAMSRSKPSASFGPTVKYLLCDLLDGPEAIARVLKENNVKM